MAQLQTPLSQDSGTLAKLSRPWLPEAFLRERLFLRLDELADRPCTWVGAPAGYGKTVLAASYVEARRAPCLWYQMDEDDADPATFFYYLGIAANQRDAGPPLPLLTPEYQDNLPAFTRRYVQAFGQRLLRPFVLLFDNFPCVPKGAILHGVLAEMLACLPTGVRCLITSRGEPPAELTRARLHGQLATLGVEELRLTLSEAEGMVELSTGSRLTSAQVQALHEQVQGWAAGLTLLLRQSSPVRALLEPTATELMFDYFAAEVFARADPTTQRFLLETALLPTMTTAMADRMTDSEVADGLLSALVQRHYFTFRDQSPEPRYRYHDLFRAFLLERGSKAFGDQECELYQRRAAAILEADGEIGAAVDMWQALGDWEQVGRLVM